MGAPPAALTQSQRTISRRRGSGASGGDRRLPATLQPTNGSRPSPFAPSRRTRPTLKKTTVRGYRSQFIVTFANRKEVLFMSTEEKQIKVEQASKLAKWFKISIEISIFGHVIFSKVWPPQD